MSGDVSSEWDGSKARLRIRAVYPEDEGEYSCIVYNDMGKAVTSAALVVESKSWCILVHQVGHIYKPNFNDFERSDLTLYIVR